MCRFLFFIVFFNFNNYAQDIQVTGHKEDFLHFENHNSITSLSPSDLNSKEHLSNLIDEVPNLTTTGGTSRPRFIQIRGIGERSSYEGMPNASVSILLDDIDYTGLAGILSTFGLESLEVYRGPQLSTKGPSALAGMIYGQTKTAQQAEGLKVSLARASFNTTNLSAIAGVISGRHGFSLVTQKNLSDGIYENAFLSRSDTSHLDEETIRLKYIYNFQSSRLILNLHSFNFDNGYDVFNFENKLKTLSDNPGKDRQYTNGASLILEVNSGSIAYKTVLSAHKTSTLYSYDEDWGNDASWNQLAGWYSDYNYRISFSKRIKTISFEQSADFQLNQLLLRLGIYTKHYQENFSEIGFEDAKERKNIQGLFKRQNIASFIQGEIQLTNQLSSFTGVRMESFHSYYSDNKGNLFEPSNLHFGGEAGLKYQHSRSNKTYLKVAKGYKTGGVNTSSSVPSNRKEFHDESLYSIELGHNSNSNDFHNSQSSLFMMFRKGIQVKTSFQDNPSDPSSFTFYTDNATEGKSLGLEHSSKLSFTPDYHLSLSGSLLKTKLGSYTYGKRNLKNREFAHAPEFSFSITPEIQLMKRLTFRARYFVQDNFYFGNSHDQKAKSFQGLDLHLEHFFNSGSLSFSVTNLLNKRRETRGFFFGNRPPSFSSERFVHLDDSRTLKLQINLELM